MEPSKTVNLSIFILLYIIIFGGSCSDLSSSQENEDITLFNNAQTSFIYSAYDRESANLIDPLPEFEVGPGQGQDRLIEPGSSATFSTEDIDGDYQFGNDIRVFLWVVRNDTARLNNSVVFTNKELEDLGFRVEIVEENDGQLIAANLESVNNRLFTFKNVSKNQRGGAKLKDHEENLLSKIKSRPTTDEVFIARIAENPNSLFQVNKTIQLPISPGVFLDMKSKKVRQRKGRTVSLFGEMMNGKGIANLVRSNRGIVGTVRNETELYEYEPLGNGLHAIIHVNQQKYPPEHSADNPSGVYTDSAYTWVDSSQVIAQDDVQTQTSTAQTVAQL